MNPILLQIWQGEGNRQWLEAHYFDESIKPIGQLRTVIPAAPNDENALLDACIAFFPQAFNDCPSLARVEELLSEVGVLDFDLRGDAIPREWPALRTEATPLFRDLNIFEAYLEPIACS